MSHLGSLSTFIALPTSKIPTNRNPSRTLSTSLALPSPSKATDPTKSSPKDPTLVKPRLPNLELTKKQHKLKLNTSHEMIRAMVSLENEQDALKDKSNFAKSFKRMSAGIKLIGGSEPSKFLNIVAENIGLYDEKNLREVTPSIKRPEIKWATNSTSMWMKRHGFGMPSTTHTSFLWFLKNFFVALDENSSGILSPNELIVPLLSLGLSNDAIYIEKALLSMFNVQSIAEITVDRDSFITVFKGDKKTDAILYNLDIYCKEMLKEEEEKKLAQQAANRRASNFLSQNTIAADKPPEKKYPTIEEFIRLIRKWWLELSHDSASVNISRIAEFIAEKGMAGNKHEGRIIAKNVESTSYFNYLSFEKIFLKAILKASLFNVAVYLAKSDFEEFSMRLKLAIVQRRLMMAGTKGRSDSYSKQGRVTLQALDKYKKKIGDDKIQGEKTTRVSIDAIDEVNEEKIVQMLFKLKDNAKQFIDDCGDVKGEIKNVWDIKANIAGNPEEYSPTPKFKEEKYIRVLEEPNTICLSSGPYDRKVKLFRENFLYKKFSKMVQLYPDIKNGNKRIM